MAIARPSIEKIQQIGESAYIDVSEEEAISFQALLENNFAIYEVLDALPDDVPEVKYPRTPGTAPTADENPLGAWYWKTHIEGASSGPLKGKRVVFKDNIMVAGVPMMRTPSGYVLFSGTNA